MVQCHIIQIANPYADDGVVSAHERRGTPPYYVYMVVAYVCQSLMDAVSPNGARLSEEQREQLLAEFSASSYEEWREVAEKSLKGAPFEKKLITRTYEDIALQPLYWPQDIEGIAHLDSLPGTSPYVRGATPAGAQAHPRDIAQTVRYGDPTEWNKALQHDLAHGQTAIELTPDTATRTGRDPDQTAAPEVGIDGLSFTSVADLEQALDGINTTQTPLVIDAGATSLPITALLIALASQRGQTTADLRGGVTADPLGMLASTGTLPLTLEEAYNDMAQVTTWASTQAPQLFTIGVNSHVYHESGGSAVQELAFVLATAVAYLRAMQQRNLTVDVVAPRMRFGFSMSGHVFMEVAKLRAARLLWTKVVEAFDGDTTAQTMTTHVKTALRNKTVYDPYVNMLRTTMEAFAGSISGCTSLQVGCFDEVIRPPDEFARRMARNTQLVLRDESHLDQVIDPAGGSWYIEALTDTVARKAWALFQEVERQGGMAKALEAGFPQQQIAEVVTRRDANLATRKDVLVGTNMYANISEKPLEAHPLDADAIYQRRRDAIVDYRANNRAEVNTKLAQLGNTTDVKRCEAAIEAALSGATIGELSQALSPKTDTLPSISPLHPYRIARSFEQIRDAVEAYTTNTGARPRAFLANMGPVAQHKARADFTTGFLQVAGIDVVTNLGFASVDEAAQAAIESDAPIVVLCSSDDTYPEIVPALVPQIKSARPDTVVLLAGYPVEQIESYQSAGVDEFIHLRANARQVLARLLELIGVAT
ncbi:MAG: methylmalonyl-CoA mutase family protein [Chloroflexota bacterium]